MERRRLATLLSLRERAVQQALKELSEARREERLAQQLWQQARELSEAAMAGQRALAKSTTGPLAYHQAHQWSETCQLKSLRAHRDLRLAQATSAQHARRVEAARADLRKIEVLAERAQQAERASRERAERRQEDEHSAHLAQRRRR